MQEAVKKGKKREPKLLLVVSLERKRETGSPFNPLIFCSNFDKTRGKSGQARAAALSK